ncbi:MAG: ABC transporter permease [Bradymonadales bacterium]|nr:ABC transporter permease [Bradymonadales bacterium]
MWKVAWRNLWRNRTRTALSIAAIGLTHALLLVFMAINEAGYQSAEQSAVKTAGGQLLVHGSGYWQSLSSRHTVDHPTAVISTLEGMVGVEAVIGRVILQGLVSSSHGSSMVRLAGIDRQQEALQIDLGPYVTQGSFLDPADQAANPLVLGRGIIHDLELELGDRVVLTATDPQGEVTRALFRLTGILETGSDSYDEYAAYTTVEAAQRAFAMGERLTQIGVLLDQNAQPDAIRNRLQRLLGERADTLEVLTWAEAYPDLVGYIETDRGLGLVFAIVAFLVVGFGIANTFLMSVMERIRELGLLGALGLGPGKILKLVICEASCLGLTAVSLGVSLGAAVNYYLCAVGLDLKMFGDIEWDAGGIILSETVIHSSFDAASWIVASLVVLAVVLASSLYPAWRARRLEPAQAMRCFQ